MIIDAVHANRELERAYQEARLFWIEAVRDEDGKAGNQVLIREVQLDALIKAGKIVQQISPFCAPVLFVAKKDGSKSLYCDFRGLNNIIVKSKFPLPRIDDIFDQWKGVTIFSKLDLASDYHQVAVKEEDPLHSFPSCLRFTFVGLFNPVEATKGNNLGSARGSRKKVNSIQNVENILKSAEEVFESICYDMAEENKRLSMMKNKGGNTRELNVGDKVLVHKDVYAQASAGAKFHFALYGPFEVIERIGSNNYKLTIRREVTKHNVFNVNMLRPYTERENDYGWVPPNSDEEMIANISQVKSIETIFNGEDQIRAKVTWKDVKVGTKHLSH